MNIDLTGKKAFITAGGDGMGRVAALTLQRLGASVVTCDINQQALDSLPDGIRRYYCDVADSQAVETMFADFIDDGLDILINNAGIAGPTKPIEAVTDAEWQACMGVGLDAAFYCLRHAVPVFKRQQHGVIINNISTAGYMGFPNRSPYSAAKWAMTGLTKTLAMELGQDNIRVNGIAPGSVTGSRMDKVIQAQAAIENRNQDDIRRQYVVGVSMQSFIDPQEIADTMAFLCSDYAKHISGQILAVDGHTETLHPRN